MRDGVRGGADGDSAVLGDLLGVDEVDRLREVRRERTLERSDGHDLQQPLIDAPQLDRRARDRPVDDLRGKEADLLGEADQRRSIGIGQPLERQVDCGDKDGPAQSVDDHLRRLDSHAVLRLDRVGSNVR